MNKIENPDKNKYLVALAAAAIASIGLPALYYSKDANIETVIHQPQAINAVSLGTLDCNQLVKVIGNSARDKLAYLLHISSIRKIHALFEDKIAHDSVAESLELFLAENEIDYNAMPHERTHVQFMDDQLNVLLFKLPVDFLKNNANLPFINIIESRCLKLKPLQTKSKLNENIKEVNREKYNAALLKTEELIRKEKQRIQDELPACVERMKNFSTSIDHESNEIIKTAVKEKIESKTSTTDKFGIETSIMNKISEVIFLRYKGRKDLHIDTQWYTIDNIHDNLRMDAFLDKPDKEFELIAKRCEIYCYKLLKMAIASRTLNLFGNDLSSKIEAELLESKTEVPS